MVDIAHFPSTYRDISWRQVWNLKKTTTEVLSSSSIDNRQFQQDVKNWRNVATRLNTSVHAFTGFFRVLFDLFTLQLFKKWMLRSILPHVFTETDAKISTIVQRLWNQRNLITPLEMINNAERYFEAHVDSFFSAPASRRFTPPIDRSVIEQQVRDYFATKRELIGLGRSVTIGRIFHATRQDATGVQILTSGILQQHNAPAGNGVYFSTQHEQGYGSLCLALDPEAIYRFRASYFPPSNSLSSNHGAIWMRVEQNVPIQWESVAHFVVSSQTHERLLRTLIEDKQHTLSDDAAIVATLPIIYTHTNEILTQCFQKSSPKLTLPPQWKRHRWCDLQAIEPFPNHFHAQEASSLLMA